MPGERKLSELLRQLRQLHQLGHDRDLLWRHDSFVVRCRQGRVQLALD
jgi:tRNA(Ile)-lysidine synthase